MAKGQKMVTFRSIFDACWSGWNPPEMDVFQPGSPDYLIDDTPWRIGPDGLIVDEPLERVDATWREEKDDPPLLTE